MSALPRPDLAPGPTMVLNDALHDLHHRAGWPSLRRLATRTGVSHTTVSKVFSRPELPSWGTLELLVEALEGDPARFHELWLAASAPPEDATRAVMRIAGRRRELDLVRRHLEGGAGLLLVAGEAGMGKTALTSEAMRTSDVLMGKGRCLPLSTEVALLPVADCLRGIWEADPGLVTGAVRACPAYVTPILAALLPEIGEGSVAPGRVDDRSLLFSAVGAVLRGILEVRRVGLLLEDLHWSDGATLDLLEHLLGLELPVPVVATWRSSDLATPPAHEEWMSRVKRLSNTTAIDLAPLTYEETAEQLNLLGSSAREQLPVIYDRSRGQPLFTEQLASHGDHRPHLPQLLGDLLDRRLEGLSEPAWTLLRALGVAERPLPVPVLAGVVDRADDDLIALLHELVDRRLLRSSGSSAVELQHPLLADAVQRRLVAGEAERTHRALATALGATAEPEAAEVAEHWRRAGEPNEELPWRIRAARVAAERLDRGQGADHWLRALAIWPAPGSDGGDPPTRHAEAYVRAMDALRASLRFEQAAALYEDADRALTGVQLEDRDRADLLSRRAIYQGEVEGLERGLELVDRALQIYARLPVSEGTVSALHHKRSLLFGLGRAEEVRAALHQQVKAARELGDPALLRDALMRQANAVGVAGDLDRARELLERAAVEAGNHDDPLGDVRRGVYATDMLLLCDAPADEVVAAGAPALAVARDHHVDNPEVLIVRFNTAASLLRAGRVDEADQLIGAMPGSPVERDRAALHLARAVIDSRRGERAPAADRIRSFWDEPRSTDSLELEFLAWAVDVLWWSGEPDERLQHLVAYLRKVAGTADVRLLAPVLLLAAQVERTIPTASAVDLVHVARECGLLEQALADDRSLATHRAAFEAELGHDRPGSLERWTRAAAGWDDLERPHDAAYARWRAAQTALRDGHGTVAQRLLRRAAADATAHVPLARAIATTAATGR